MCKCAFLDSPYNYTKLLNAPTKKNTKIRNNCTAIQGCKNTCRQVAVATKLCTVEPNICGSSVWYLLHVT